ncbi:MAG: aldolase/citrate lyase family protein [Isosphaeraceae bacterium]
MKTNSVKQALREGKPQVGTWLSLGSPFAARYMARTGLPWLTVDMEHSQPSIETASLMFGAIADAGCIPLVRIPANRHDVIKVALDCGAMGIVAPMVMSADEARAIVAATRYPPIGNRSVGGSLHALNYAATSDAYFRRANDEILVVIQAEHIDAIDIADEIYSVPGVDAVFIGPNDLAASMRAADGMPPTPEALEAAFTRVREAAQRQGIAPGMHVFSAADALKRIAEGWRFLAVNSELRFMLQGASDLVKQLAQPGDSAPELARY